MHRLTGRCTGFTLIELLVVIAIIAILVAILMPVIGSVQEKARQGRCSANMIQIATALRAYKTDYGRYPFRPYYDGERGMYLGGVSALYPDYVRNKAILICPNDAANLRGLEHLEHDVPVNYSTYNGLVAGFVSDTSHTGANYWQFARQSDFTQAGDATTRNTITYNYGGFNNHGWDRSYWDGSRWVSAQDWPVGGNPPEWLRQEGKRWRDYPRLINPRAPDNTIALRCRAHHKWYGRDETTSDPDTMDTQKWRDVIVRLGGEADTVDYYPWTREEVAGASQWRIQK